MKQKNFYIILALTFSIGFYLVPSISFPVTCDGTEVLCLDLTSNWEVEASGGIIIGGDFNSEGFMPYNEGGIDWFFGIETNFASGSIDVDVKGLLPVNEAEDRGGKVSIFSFCGRPEGDTHSIGLQKMAPDYRDGHIFRFGMDDDNLADNWDAVIITGRDFGCYYSINDPPWGPDETHHFHAEWSSAGLVLQIDDFRCESGGNGDTFDPIEKMFTLAARCTHYANQQAVARFSNLRLIASNEPVHCGNHSCEAEYGEDCISCPYDCGDCPEEIYEEIISELTEEQQNMGDETTTEEVTENAVWEEITSKEDSSEEPTAEPGASKVEGGCSCNLLL